MDRSTSGAAAPRDAFNRLLGELRPKLHRYCARMTGSVIDGEDVVQEALADAIASFSETMLGYSLQEIGEITTTSIPAVKAALHRGRTRLRELAQEPDARPVPVLSEPERTRLARYVDRFNARDFDTLCDMLADEVKLDLVARRQLSGRNEVKEYFHQYFVPDQWHMARGFVDRRPALLAYDRNDPTRQPAFFVLLDWRVQKLINIRDFLFARYAIDDAEVILAE